MQASVLGPAQTLELHDHAGALHIYTTTSHHQHIQILTYLVPHTTL